MFNTFLIVYPKLIQNARKDIKHLTKLTTSNERCILKETTKRKMIERYTL